MAKAELRLSLYYGDTSHHASIHLEESELRDVLMPWREREYEHLAALAKSGSSISYSRGMRHIEARKHFIRAIVDVFAGYLETMFRKIENAPNSGPPPKVPLSEYE